MKGNPDYYAALGITPQAGAGEVARAYRMMMRARHPDTTPASAPAPAPAPAPTRNVPWRSRPFLAVVLPTRVRPPGTGKGRTGRKEQ